MRVAGVGATLAVDGSHVYDNGHRSRFVRRYVDLDDGGYDATFDYPTSLALSSHHYIEQTRGGGRVYLRISECLDHHRCPRVWVSEAHWDDRHDLTNGREGAGGCDLRYRRHISTDTFERSLPDAVSCAVCPFVALRIVAWVVAASAGGNASWGLLRWLLLVAHGAHASVWDHESRRDAHPDCGSSDREKLDTGGALLALRWRHVLRLGYRRDMAATTRPWSPVSQRWYANVESVKFEHEEVAYVIVATLDDQRIILRSVQL